MIRKKDENEKPVIDLTSPIGNAYALLGQASTTGKQLGFSREKIKKIHDEMTASDYENLIKVFDSYFGDFIDLVR